MLFVAVLRPLGVVETSYKKTATGAVALNPQHLTGRLGAITEERCLASKLMSRPMITVELFSYLFGLKETGSHSSFFIKHNCPQRI